MTIIGHKDITMTDIYQCLRLTTVKELFPEELQYIKDHVWDYARTNSAVLLLLNDDKLSLNHLESIHRQIETDKAAAIKAEEETKLKQRDSNPFIGGRRQY
jgi:hypothetical protein